MPTIDLASLAPGALPGEAVPCGGVPEGMSPGDSGDGGDNALGWLAGLEPGPVAMSVLAGIDVARLDPPDRVAVLLAWERQNAWVHAHLQAATVAVGGAEPSTDRDWGRERGRGGVDDVGPRCGAAVACSANVDRAGRRRCAITTTVWHSTKVVTPAVITVGRCAAVITG